MDGFTKKNGAPQYREICSKRVMAPNLLAEFRGHDLAGGP